LFAQLSRQKLAKPTKTGLRELCLRFFSALFVLLVVRPDIVNKTAGRVISASTPAAYSDISRYCGTCLLPTPFVQLFTDVPMLFNSGARSYLPSVCV